MILTFVAAASAQSDWSGFYAGGNIGDAIGRSTADTSTQFNQLGYFLASSVLAVNIAGRQKLKTNAFSGGLEAGFNAQSGNVVFGGELDYESLRLRESQSSTAPYPCCSPTDFTVVQSFTTRWLATARPRVGFAIGETLVYATAGVAVTKVNYQEVFTDTYATAAEGGFVNKRKTGWVGGFGIAVPLPIEHWSAKGEYLYTDFGRTAFTTSNLTAFTPPIPYPANVFTHSLALHAHIIRAGVNYRW
jgi:outer membrane immunogenic protein